ncbi:hypothetical protein LMJ38_24230 [Streptomyces sp. R1]|uniref:hypothetical protein n=1 Tax=Streptomyces sp. R1 TaxID=1509279 RepID=UPI001E3A2D24|nr:hypothetical protein [Streptomyces sp. R1]MCC8339028.1 hypothetical protein [Streptomyces sp. R1]
MNWTSENTSPAADIAHGTVDLAGARRCLDEGRALVVPAPSPLTSFVVATHAAAVRNAVGGGQARLALAMPPQGALGVLGPFLRLSGPGWTVAARLMGEGGLTVAMPLRSRQRLPDWIVNVVWRGCVMVQSVPWPALQQVLPAQQPIFCAEARRRGAPAVRDTARAILDFPLNVSVLGRRTLYGPGADTVPGPGCRPTVVALTGKGGVSLVSSGAQDQGADSRQRYLADLRARCTPVPAASEPSAR